MCIYIYIYIYTYTIVYSLASASFSPPAVVNARCLNLRALPPRVTAPCDMAEVMCDLCDGTIKPSRAAGSSAAPRPVGLLPTCAARAYPSFSSHLTLRARRAKRRPWRVFFPLPDPAPLSGTP